MIIKDLSNTLKSFFLFVLVSLLHNIFVCCHHCKKADTADMKTGWAEKNKPGSEAESRAGIIICEGLSRPRSKFINLLSSS
jgi:hypothetical protein